MNNSLYDTVQLSKRNCRHYRWDELTKEHVWNIVEKEVPDGYSVQYESSSNTVTIINKFVGTDETTTEQEKLAQTGLLIFSVGWAMLKETE